MAKAAVLASEEYGKHAMQSIVRCLVGSQAHRGHYSSAVFLFVRQSVKLHVSWAPTYCVLTSKSGRKLKQVREHGPGLPILWPTLNQIYGCPGQKYVSRPHSEWPLCWWTNYRTPQRSHFQVPMPSSESCPSKGDRKG